MSIIARHTKMSLPVIEGTGSVSAESKSRLVDSHARRVAYLAAESDHGYPAKLLRQAVLNQLDKRVAEAARVEVGAYGRELVATLRFESDCRPFLSPELGKACLGMSVEDTDGEIIDTAPEPFRFKVTEFDDPMPSRRERFVVIHAKQLLGAYSTALEVVSVQNRQVGVLLLDSDRDGTELTQSLQILSVRDESKPGEQPDGFFKDHEAVVREHITSLLNEPYKDGYVLPVAETVYEAHRRRT